MPEVSVVIPTYNRAYCLPRAMRSVLLQSCRDFEIIVVDDGSTDETENVCRKFMSGSAAIRYAVQPNKGVSAARNLGIELATGNLIAFLDSDDIWLPQKLERQVGLMKSDPSFSMSFTNFFYFRDNGAINRKTEIIPQSFLDNPYPDILTIRENIVVTPSVVARKAALEREGGFNEGLVICEDIDLWCRIVANGRLGAVKENLVGVHIRDTSGKFRYGKDILGRCELYSLAYARDPDFSQDYLRELLKELANCFIGVATDLQDHQVIADLSALVHSSLSPVAFMAELKRIAKRFTAEGF